MTSDAGDAEKEVFSKELEEIKKRREGLNLDSSEISDKPAVDNELCGLALSGGGIRSATFSLGVIQSLAQRGLLKNVDYLSTVSGGGYIGSCLSSLLNDPNNKPDGDAFPLKFTTGAEEPPALIHLRDSSNFLTPSGLLNKLRLPNLLLRGIMMMLFVFLPFIMGAVFVAEAAYELGPHWDNLPKLILPLIVLFMILAIAFPFLLRVMRRLFDWRRRNSYELLLTVPLLVAGVVLVMIPLMHVTTNAIEHSTEQVRLAMHGIGWQGVWHVSAVCMAAILLFMLAGKASENVAKLRGKVVLTLVGLLGPAIIFLIFILLCLWQIDSPFVPVSSANVLNDAVECGEKPCLSETTGKHLASGHRKRAYSIVGVGEAHASEATADSSSKHLIDIVNELISSAGAPTNYEEFNHALAGRNITFWEDAVVTCISGSCDTTPTRWKEDTRVWLVNDGRHGHDILRNVCPDFEPPNAENLSFTQKLAKSAESVGSVLKRIWPFSQEPTALVKWTRQNCTYFTRGSQRSLRIEGAQLGLFTNERDFWFVGAFFLLFVFNRVFLDINITSPHGFYRDRLSRAFLFKISSDNRTVQVDGLKLSELNANGSSAPYHLINVALNLQGSNDADLRGRMSDFFIFSKHHCGSKHTGYVRTRILEKYDGHLDLATAMAISGAAAAPNMGTTTSRSLTFVMTLLNVRLGYWLPNPKKVKETYWRKPFDLSGARSTLVLKEALGLLDAKGSHVNVSDGGHIENLAIYPLLKRRCKYIISVDGEADPDMTFGGLTTLMRLARIDMGVEIEMDLEGLRKDIKGYSKVRWAKGTIHYGNGETGHLLYVKLSVNGDEPEYIRAYRSKETEFPHQSTADQFFTEEQFEAYRALGEDISQGMLDDVEKRGGLEGLNGSEKG
ncbi:MAG: patatin-like phospholipase family protein [Woeseiaceae bacterium]